VQTHRRVGARLERVRKQYHFRPGEVGFDAWDVDRLIELTEELPIIEVQVDSIREVDTDHWFKLGPEPTVRRIIEQFQLINEVDPSYPIILGADGRLMDGMHRVVRAVLDGRSTIAAVRFEQDPEPDYRNSTPGELPYDR